jgi:hypothetical protein
VSFTQHPEEPLVNAVTSRQSPSSSSLPLSKKKKNSARLPRVAVAWVRNYLAELALYFGVGGKREEAGEK